MLFSTVNFSCPGCWDDRAWHETSLGTQITIKAIAHASDIRCATDVRLTVCEDGVLTPYVPFVLAVVGAAKDNFWILESSTLNWTEQTRAAPKSHAHRLDARGQALDSLPARRPEDCDPLRSPPDGPNFGVRLSGTVP